MSAWPSLAALSFAVTHPRFLPRRLAGLPLMEATLDEISEHLPAAPVVLEAGACDGGDTDRFARRWPGGTIHAFEPVPDSYEQVVARAGMHANVRTYPLALSSSSGTALINVSEDVTGAARPDASSLLAPAETLDAWPSIVFRTSVEVPTTTLDDWARDHAITHVDLMWLDLQGMELAVLEASPWLLERTRCIYMEVFRRPLYAGAPLYKEVLRSMSTRGFTARIDRVHRIAGNILFVRTDAVDRPE